MNEQNTAVGPPPAGETEKPSKHGSSPTVGVACGAVGILAAVWAYWFVFPGLVLGIAAIALGVRARRRGSSELSSVAIALGIVSILLVPSVLVMIAGAEDWGRHCVVNPSDPDC